jgi:hypothetical protein
MRLAEQMMPIAMRARMAVKNKAKGMVEERS